MLPWAALLLVGWAEASGCPSQCTCARLSNESLIPSEREGWFVECAHRGLRGLGSQRPDQLDLATLPHPTLRLVLRGNRFPVLQPNSFRPLPALTHLDLRDCGIAVLGRDAFRHLEQLKDLDLGGNLLETVNSSMLAGLESLEALELGGNPLPVLPAGSLRGLGKLRSLGLDETGLSCDCGLRWLVRWLRRRKVTLSPDARCRSPLHLRGRHLGKLKRRNLVCPSRFTPRLFELEPKDDTRLVFPGDSLQLVCRVVVGAEEDVAVEWSHGPRDLRLQPSLSLSKWTSGTDDGAKELGAKVSLRTISAQDQGTWSCRAEAAKGGAQTLKLQLQVMGSELLPPPPPSPGSPSMVQDEPSFSPRLLPGPTGPTTAAPDLCPAVVEDSRWGSFSWLPTLPGEDTRFQCPFSRDEAKPGFAHRQCLEDGVWKDSAVDKSCLPGSRVARAIQTEFQEVRSADWGWENLINATEALGLGSPAETSFEVHSVVAAMEGLAANGSAASAELRLTERLLSLPAELLQLSEVEHGSLGRLEELLHGLRPSPSSLGPSLSEGPLCEASFKPLPDRPLTVLAAQSPAEPEGLRCGIEEELWGLVGAVSGRLCEELLSRAESELPFMVGVSFVRLPNGRLWEGQWDAWSCHGPVLGLRVEDVMAAFARDFPKSRQRRSTPAPAVDPNITLASTTTTPGPEPSSWLRLSLPVPLLTGTLRLGVRLNGSWAFPDGCEIHTPRGDVEGDPSRAAVFCGPESTVQAILGAAMDESGPGAWLWLGLAQPTAELDEWKRPPSAVVLPPWLLAACGCVALCLLASSLTYCFCLAATPISLKLRHSLVNSWLCASGLVLLFGLGVGEISAPAACLRISAALHYLLTASLLWHSVTLRTVQRKLTNKLNPKPQDDDPSPPARHGPILGLYFLSYGLPLMFLAFALALNPRDLGRSRTSCAPIPAGVVSGTLYGPLGLAWAVTLGLAVAGLWTGRELERRLGRRPVTPALDGASECLMTPRQARDGAAGERNSLASTAASSLLDRELPEMAQLRFALLSFGLATAAATSAAAFVAGASVPGVPAWLSDYISSGFCSLFLALLGVVVFYGYVVRRPGLGCCGPRRPKASPQPTLKEAKARPRSRSRASRSLDASSGAPRSVGVDASSGGWRRRDPRTPLNTSVHSSDASQVLSSERERRLRSMAKAYHRRRAEGRVLDVDEEPYGSLQRQVILEEPPQPHDYVNLSSSLAAPLSPQSKVSPAPPPHPPAHLHHKTPPQHSPSGIQEETII